MFFIKKFFKGKNKNKGEFSSKKLMELTSDKEKREYIISYSREEIKNFFKDLYDMYAHKIEENILEFNKALTDKRRSFRNKEYTTYAIENKISSNINTMNSQIEELMVIMKLHSHLKAEDIENIKENFRILTLKALGVKKELREKLKAIQEQRTKKRLKIEDTNTFRTLAQEKEVSESSLKALLETLIDKPFFLVENYLKWLTIKTSLNKNLLKVKEIMGIEELSSEQRLAKLRKVDGIIEIQLVEMEIIIQEVEVEIDNLNYLENLTTEQEEILVECSKPMSIINELDYNYIIKEREKIAYIKNKLMNEVENNKAVEKEREILSSNSVDGTLTPTNFINTVVWK